jgi:hypothetical protein
LSAARTGPSPSRSSRASTNRSTSVFGQSVFITAGAAGFVSGLNDHHARCSAVICIVFAAGAGATFEAGQGAPCAIHCSKAAMTAGESLSSPFGIGFTPSSCRIMRIRRLFPGSPATMAGP